ncbi:MAG: proline--tRNA ligase [Bacillota bacterium]
MKVTELLMPTLRETPAEAEVVSHQLLVRAGFIRKSAAGVYTYLPLAWRVIRKIEGIIREEMDREGGQEILMPILQPAELWKESGRWDVYGPELFRLKDRHGRDFSLGPTHEEIITDLVRNEVSSYKQLPLLLYQIQNKYRDERRPRFGLMRGREFIMKDLYSFDRDEEGLDITYTKMYQAYTRIFSRCGLKFRPVEADSGAIGGNNTHEFMVLADSGEAVVVYCPAESCGYAANVEKAESPPDLRKGGENAGPAEEVATPGMRTVDQVTSFLGVSPEQLIKTLIYRSEKGPVAALVRGDREANEIKIMKAVGAITLDLAGPDEVARLTGAEAGFAGPVGLTGVTVVADREVGALSSAVTGANRTGFHLVKVCPGRDFKPDVVADIRLVQAGDPCPCCGAPLVEARGIEVGQVFKLGEKYSKALGATFLDEKGQKRPIVMGCYGIGVTRTMAAAIEQNHDENGIIWPAAIAPYHAIVIPVSAKDGGQSELAWKVYRMLWEAGIEAVIDDRNERPGVKFKDADLIGYPVRITVGSKSVASGGLEVRSRRSGETVMAPLENLPAVVSQLLQGPGAAS